MKITTLFLSAAVASAFITAASCGSTSGSCTADNCAGCCNAAGACESGTAVSACGKNAAQCATCTGEQVCNTAQVCAFDGSSKWRVQPLSATVKTNNNGAQWDNDSSAPDPAVELFCPHDATDKTATTATVSDSYSPTWAGDGCVVSADTLINGGFAYQVIDEDPIGGDPITAKINVTVTEADLLAGTAPVSATDGLTALSIALQKQ